MKALRSISFALVTGLAVMLVHVMGTDAPAQSSYFASRCGTCHSGATGSTCIGCHKHGGRTVSATTNKSAYAPGETVSVSVSAASSSGWFRAMLFDQNGNEIARSAGNQSGMGSSSTSPATLTAPAPLTPGSYTWKAAWYGHQTDNAALGTGWTADSGNANHGRQTVNIAAFTVTGPPDTTAPTVTAFTLPATSASLTIPVTLFTASDNTAVTGYMVTTSSSAPAAGAAGWKTAGTPMNVTAPGEGSVTFYAWAKDAAGNVSASASATVAVTLPPADTTAPTVTRFILPATSETQSIPVDLAATDNVGVTGYLVTTSSSAPAAGAAGWSSSVTAVSAPSNGSITFYAWAKDAAGNVSASSTATVEVNVVSSGPILTVSTLDNGSYTKVRTLNVGGTASDVDGLAAVTVNKKPATVEGNSFSRALQLARGANTITVVATDSLGNTTTDTRTITFDPKAPSLAITRPADNLKTAASFVTVTGKTNENDITVTYTVNGGGVQYAEISGRTFSANVNLTEGINTIQLTATDLAGNTSTRKRTVVYDHTSPTLEITDPSQDVTTGSPKLLLKGEVSDDLPIAVKVAVNGKSSSAGVKKGAFQKRITFKEAGTYTITVTAKDSVGNTSTVTRSVIYAPQNNEDDDEGAPVTQHPFGWTNPRSSHQSYVNSSNVTSCTSCHSIDAASKGKPMSCYNCHGNKWGTPTTGGGTTTHPFGWTNPRSSHQSYVERNGVSSCTGCHSTASSSKGQPMSCYNCHGKKW